jgi:hypothetical protein
VAKRTRSNVSPFRTSLFVLALACAPLACSDGSPGGTAVDQNGNVELGLTTGGVSIASVAYTITGPGGYSKSGTIDVSGSSTVSTLIGAIPAGNGYSITLSATPTSGATGCSGSATFSVVARQTVPVSVDLMCHQTRTTGSVVINGNLNVCATLNDVSAVPNEVAVGGNIALSADASDTDGPSSVSYSWTTTGGTLSGASAKNASLTCTAPGSVTVSVTVSDGDPACKETGSVTITCVAGSSGGAGGTAGSGGMNATGGAGGSSAGAGGGAGASAGAATGGTSGNAGTAGTSGSGAGGMATGGAGAGGAGAGGAGAGATGAGAGGAGAGGAGAGGAGAGGAGAGGAGAGGSAGASGASSTMLAVFRVGNGSAGLTSAGTPVFVDIYTSGGVLDHSVAMPTAANGSNHMLTASGVATSDGQMTLSTNGQYLIVPGYDAAPGTASVASFSGARVVGRVNAAGAIDTTTALTDAGNNNNRSAASVDGTAFWIGSASTGVRYALLGATTSTQLSTTVTNVRQVQIFNSQLFVSDASGSTSRLGLVGTGLPTASGQTIAPIPGYPKDTTVSPYGYFFADLSTSVDGLDTLYVADDGIGITKYSLVAGTWTSNGTVGTAGDQYRGLTATVSSGVVTLYATGLGGSATAGGGKLVSLTDASGYNAPFSGTPNVLTTAANQTAFRGVTLAPQ